MAGFDAGGACSELAAGVNLFGADGKWSGFVSGSLRFGDDDYVGYGGNVGLRYNW